MGRILDDIIKNKKGAARREAYGTLSGGVGIAANSALGVSKLVIGLVTGSVAVMADSINNLTDAASSVATLIGFKLASRERDKEHPFGHARIEYMTGVIIAALVTVVGVQLITQSVDKIIHPEHVTISSSLIIFFIVLIAVKIWLWRFNLRLAADIDSKAIKATAIDCRNDVITSTAVLISVLLDKVVGFPADGYVGTGVAIFIVVSGMILVRDTAAPLLGQAPDKNLVVEVMGFVRSFEGVIGVHDLVLHDYGPGSIFASVHVEVDAHKDVMRSHEIMDEIEKSVLAELGIELVCHMDPVDTKDPLVYELRETLTGALMRLPCVRGLHDLRIVRGPTRTNVIFDVILSPCDEENKEIVSSAAKETLAGMDGKMIGVITFDEDYS